MYNNTFRSMRPYLSSMVGWKWKTTSCWTPKAQLCQKCMVRSTLRFERLPQLFKLLVLHMEHIWNTKFICGLVLTSDSSWKCSPADKNFVLCLVFFQTWRQFMDIRVHFRNHQGDWWNLRIPYNGFFQKWICNRFWLTQTTRTNF